MSETIIAVWLERCCWKAEREEILHCWGTSYRFFPISSHPPSSHLYLHAIHLLYMEAGTD